MKRTSHRAWVSAGFALALGASVIAVSAATLGSLSSRQLGADSALVASCDTDGVSISYTNTYDATAQAYVVSSAVVSGIAAACAGEKLDVQLIGAQGSGVASATQVTVSTTSHTVTFASPPSANVVVGSAIVIAGV